MKKGTKKILIIVITLLIICVAYLFLRGDDTAQIEAKTLIVKRGEVTTMVTATGTVEPITQVEVGTQVSGVVQKIYVDYNSAVKAGQLIAELDKTNLKSALSQAQASYNNAINEKKYLETIYNRQNTLFNNKVISKSDFDDAQYNLNNSKSAVVQRLSDLQKARTNLSYANIYSPIDGVVLSRAIDEGQTVAASFSTPTLFTIAKDLKQMQVEADVDEADIGQVTEGQRVTFTVDAYQNEEFKGTVTQVRLDPTITSNVVTYTVVIKADNPDLKLKPGLTATISIYTLELNNILTIEAKAVNFKPNMQLLEQYSQQNNLKPSAPNGPPPNEGDMNESVVWLMGQNKEIKPQQLKLGASDGVNVQVIEGVAEGDNLVFSLKATSENTGAKGGDGTESPFMPKPPGKKK